MALKRETALHQAWLRRVRGGVSRWVASDVDSDGRSRARTLRAVLAEGWLQEDADAERAGSPFYVVRDEVVNEVVASKPDLVALKKLDSMADYMLREVRGALVDELSTEALRYVAEHMSDYRFFDAWGKDRTAELDSYWRELYVRDDAFDAALAALLDKARLVTLTKANLAWGLVSAGAAREEDKDVFKAGPFGGPTFSDDPDKWGQDAERVAASLREDIARAQSKLDAVVKADAFVRGQGGWDKFVAEYRVRLAEALKEEEAKKATGSEG